MHSVDYVVPFSLIEIDISMSIQVVKLINTFLKFKFTGQNGKKIKQKQSENTFYTVLIWFLFTSSYLTNMIFLTYSFLHIDR